MTSFGTFTKAGVFLIGLVSSFGSAHAGARLETAKEDPGVISARLRTPSGLYPGIVALGFDKSVLDKGYDPSGKADYRLYCTGILLTSEWVVTQAYCIEDQLSFANIGIGNIRVRYGNVDLKVARQVGIVSIVKHEYFTRNPSINNSIALVKLAKPIDEKPAVISRRMPSASLPKENSTGSGVTVGWGSLFLTENREQWLYQRHLAVRLIGNEDCSKIEYIKGHLKPTMICAASALKDIDACMGFGGAPLMLPGTRGRFVTYGMVSWGGVDCGKADSATVYTNLVSYIDWIEEKIGPLRNNTKSLSNTDGGDTNSDSTQAESSLGRLNRPHANIAPEGLFRYMVSIGRIDPEKPTIKVQSLIHQCGGVLLNSKWVLTAGHCVSGLKDKPELLQLKIDSEVLSQKKGEYLKAKHIIIHDNYHLRRYSVLNNKRVPENDLALIEIDGEVPADIEPPPLVDPTWEAQLLGKNGDNPRDLVVIGWGKNASSRFGKPKDHLHWITIKTIRRADCNGPKSYHGVIGEGLYCAGSEDADTCDGDSGGPLLVVDNSEFALLGIVSWGDGCGKKDKPGVYVRLPSHYDWIESALKTH